MFDPATWEDGGALLSARTPRLYTTGDVSPEGMGRRWWVLLTTAAVAFASGLVCTLFVLVAAPEYYAHASTELHIRPPSQAFPRPPAAARAPRAPRVPLWAAQHPAGSAKPAASPMQPTKTADAEEALQAASAALEKALDKAEVILRYILSDDAKDMDLQKAQKAAQIIGDLVDKRRKAAKGAADPAKALALVEHAEREQALVNAVVAAMLSKQDAENARPPSKRNEQPPSRGSMPRVEGAAQPLPSVAASSAPRNARATPAKPPAPKEDPDDPQEALNAAVATLHKALERAEVILMYFLKEEARDMTLEKAEKVLEAVGALVATRRAAARTAADPAPALALVEHAEKEQVVVRDLVSALVRKQEAETALAAAGRAAQGPPAGSGPAPAGVPSTQLDDPHEALKAADAALDGALDKAEVVLVWVLGPDAEDMSLAKAQKALTAIDNLLEKRWEVAEAAADPVQPLALVEQAQKKQLLLRNVVAAMLLREDAARALGRPVRRAARVPPPGAEAAPRPATNLEDPREALEAADAALQRALGKAEVVLTWVLGPDARDMSLAKARRVLHVIDDLVTKRKEAVQVAADPVQARALVKKAEKKQLVVSNVVSAMLLKQEAEQALGASGAAQPSPPATPVTAAPRPASTPAPRDSLHTDLADPEEALQAANVALDKALDKAQATLMFLLGRDAQDMSIEKAERALKLMADKVQQRKEAAKAAPDPVQALALVEKEEKQQQLVQKVVSAMVLRKDSEQALGVSAVAVPSSAAKSAKGLSPTNLDDPEEALTAASAALDQALDKADVILNWVLGAEARGMTLEKARTALAEMENLVGRRKRAAQYAADPALALALVEKAEQKQLLVENVVAAMVLKEDAGRALGRSKGTARPSLSAGSEAAPPSAAKAALSSTESSPALGPDQSSSESPTPQWLLVLVNIALLGLLVCLCVSCLQ